MAFVEPWVASGGTLSPTYCSVEDVARFLGYGSSQGDLFYSEDPNAGINDLIPTEPDVESVILDVEDEIDMFCKKSWRPIRVVNEYKTMDDTWRYNIGQAYTLDYQHVLQFDKTKGDSIQVWLYTGSNWTEFLGVYQEGRGLDFWCDYEQGVLYFHTRRPIRKEKAVKLTYRVQYSGNEVYDTAGNASTAQNTYIPRDIKRAAILLSASWLIQQNNTTMFIMEGVDKMSIRERVENYEKKAYSLLERNRDMVYFVH
jgi:hypothetical protein